MVLLKKVDWITQEEVMMASLDKWQRVVDLMTKLLGATAGYVVEYNEKLGFLAALTSKNPENPSPKVSGKPQSLDANLYCRRVVGAKSAFYEPDASNKPEWADNPEVVEEGYISYFGVPLMWPNGVVFGTLCVFDTKATAYENTLQELMEVFRDLIEADLRLYEQYEIMRNLSMTDPLTGMSNRAGFELLAQQKIRIAKRYHHNIGIIFIDLDDMKHWNDDYGHAAGDAALRAVAKAITDSIREVDICGRIGGDEFAVLGYVRNRGDLTTIITRVRNALDHAKLTVPTSKSPIRETPKISSGASVFFDPLDKSLEDMMAIADLEMYRDKKSRRK
ncbi:sensor domain-containing diguanylate cyclase [Thalassospira sp.]|uniref:sensor domain-containing diguanylate cyclase n=1 Tax=Thalassospira sp. TaxID=1912094 RepID=UPI0025E899B4|nr:sensor domain-containing diguanylate cyclase [Thalassospira sp.]|tara:strand:+ start:5792 stop:6793 length:1002 start_codon:yes stop_codon:yes gene_type:complete